MNAPPAVRGIIVEERPGMTLTVQRHLGSAELHLHHRRNTVQEDGSDCISLTAGEVEGLVWALWELCPEDRPANGVEMPGFLSGVDFGR